MNGPRRSSESRVEVAIAVVEREGEFLVGLRPEGSALAGYWEFPGGKIESDETPAIAACRECLEETGWEVRVVGAYPTADHDYRHASMRVHFLACVPARQRGPLPPRFRWVPRGELCRYRFPEANAALLEQLANSGSTC